MISAPSALDEEFDFLARASSANRIRGMRQFAEDEIILPDVGVERGRKFRCDFQPFTRPLLDEMDNQRWKWIALRGPAQSSKSICGFVIPAMYHLFEMQETIILAAPTEKEINTKWTRDLRPMIERSKYKEFLPTSGQGSEGGDIKTLVTFRNGPIMRVMTAGGGYKTRAEFTSRVIIVTEANVFGVTSENSAEANKMTQLEARTQGFDDNFRIYLECTPETEDDLICSTVSKGSNSTFFVPCPHCSKWISPLREHLLGYSGCSSDKEALEQAYFVCPACRHPITKDERLEANKKVRLVHSGQEVDTDGNVTGAIPNVLTLGVWWSAFPNMFMSPGTLGMHEWRAGQAKDRDDAERGILQMKWGLPDKASTDEVSGIRIEDVMGRSGFLEENTIPNDCVALTMGVDVNKYILHYFMLARRSDDSFVCPHYGTVAVPAHDMEIGIAIKTALRCLRDDYVLQGYKNETGQMVGVDAVWIDSRYEGSHVKSFCDETNADATGVFMPIQGYGSDQPRGDIRRNTGAKVKAQGENYEFVQLPDGQIVVQIDSDRWKTQVHNMFKTKMGQPGSISLYTSPGYRHKELARHLTAETKSSKHTEKHGLVTKWSWHSKENHFLDGAYIARAANHYAAWSRQQANLQPIRTVKKLATPDGRAFLLTER